MRPGSHTCEASVWWFPHSSLQPRPSPAQNLPTWSKLQWWDVAVLKKQNILCFWIFWICTFPAGLAFNMGDKLFSEAVFTYWADCLLMLSTAAFNHHLLCLKGLQPSVERTLWDSDLVKRCSSAKRIWQQQKYCFLPPSPHLHWCELGWGKSSRQMQLPPESKNNWIYDEKFPLHMHTYKLKIQNTLQPQIHNFSNFAPAAECRRETGWAPSFGRGSFLQKGWLAAQ